jgi:hypothetical protein
MWTKEEAKKKCDAITNLMFAIEMILFVCSWFTTSIVRQLCLALMMIFAIYFNNLSSKINENTPEYKFDPVAGENSRIMKNLESLRRLNSFTSVKEEKEEKVNENEKFLEKLIEKYQTNKLGKKISFPLGPVHHSLKCLRESLNNSNLVLLQFLNKWDPKITVLEKSSTVFKEPRQDYLLKKFKSWEKLFQDTNLVVNEIENYIKIIESHPTFLRDLDIWKQEKCDDFRLYQDYHFDL